MFSKVRQHQLPCLAPMNNLVLDSFGKVKMCCNQADVPLGIYPEQSLRDIWFGSARKNIIEEFTKGRIPSICSSCLSNVSFNLSPTAKVQTSKTLRPSHFTDYPRQIDFSLSNRCNLKCAMCSWDSSSQFIETEKQRLLQVNYGEAFLDEIKVFLEKAEYLVFSGGEPFLIPIYYQLWDMINDCNPDAAIYVQTNGTVYNERIESLIKNHNISIGISIDSLKAKGVHHIRVGADYAQLLSNIEAFKKLSKETGRALTFTITPMTLNIEEVPELFSYCHEHNIMIGISLLEHPSSLAVWSLSSQRLLEIISLFDDVKDTDGDVVEQWNRATIKQYKALLVQYHQQKKKNEDHRKAIIQSINANSAGAFQRLMQELQQISVVETQDDGDIREVIQSVNDLMEEAQAANNISELCSIKDFLSSFFSGTQLVSLHKYFGDPLFRLNAGKKFAHLLYIFSANSFDKLN